MTQNTLQTLKTTTLIALIFIAISSWFYYRYFYTPVSILQNTLLDFEKSIREKNSNGLQAIVSEKSAIYSHLSSPDLLNIFDDFYPGLEVVSANFRAGSKNQTIHGIARMRSKTDEKYHELNTLYIEKEEGIWKIRQLALPDYSNLR